MKKLELNSMIKEIVLENDKTVICSKFINTLVEIILKYFCSI